MSKAEKSRILEWGREFAPEAVRDYEEARKSGDKDGAYWCLAELRDELAEYEAMCLNGQRWEFAS